MDKARLELTLKTEEDEPNIAFYDQDGDSYSNSMTETLFVANQQNLFATDADGNRVPWRSAKTPKKED